MSGNEESPTTPILRFPGFPGEWKETLLGYFFTFKNGVNADRSMYGAGRKFINVMDVISGRPIYHDDIIGSVTISDKEFEKNRVICGDILFQRSSETREEVGQSNIYLDSVPATFGGFVIRGRPKEPLDSRYFDALLKTEWVRRDMTSRSGGSTRYNIGQQALEAVSVHVAPAVAEQERIADFHCSIDARLVLSLQYEEALTAYKTAIMQRIFSQQLRFTNADGSHFPDWEERRLGTIATFSKGRGISKNDLAYQGNIPCIRYAELYTIYGEIIDDVIHATNELQTSLLLSEAGDVIVPASGESALEIGAAACVMRGGVALGGDLNIIRSEIHGPFLARYLRHAKQRELASLAQGNSVVHLYGTHLKELKIDFPCPDEQRKIADFLFALDAKIDAVAVQLAAMQSFKKAMLQRMFV